MAPDMKVPDSLIAVLRCPDSHQALSLADPDTLGDLNKRITAKQVSNRGGVIVGAEIEAGLIREDQQRIYPIQDGFPIMLIDEAIDLA